ncbi:MAG: hypothetical protein KJ714_04035 [Euryarchaeota archaeon]|nr:hypothetical protein [Euryarchaeota archaeon]
METETVTELKKIRADLDMLTNLYAKLIDRLVPEEEPEAEDPVPIKSLDITKLKGEKNKYRIRKGKFRIVYE